MNDKKRPGYNPFKEGIVQTLVPRGFFNEYELTVDGTPEYDGSFVPQFEAFLSNYQDTLPKFEEFVNSWRQAIGLDEEYPQNPNEGAAVEGFRADFDQIYEPYWLGFPDLPLEPGKIFTYALNAFFKSFKGEGPVTSQALSTQWHQFLEIDAVCFNSTARLGEYKKLKVFSYEEVYIHYFEEEHLHRDFKPRLTFFCDQMITKKGYFLPSHHFEEWVESVEADYAQFLDILESEGE